MSKYLGYLFVTALTFAGCSGENDKKNAEFSEPDTVAATSPGHLSKINYGTSQVIDSTGYVLFPLIGTVEGADQGGDSYSSSDRYREATYWNIVFYNSATKEQHLLNPDRKLIFTGYSIASSSDDNGTIHEVTGPGTAEASKLIFYKVISEDVNKNGDIDIDDPEYLFISDKAGNGFKQISPANALVTGWEVVDRAGLLLIHARVDSNKDGKVNTDDRYVCYLYDLKNGGEAKPVFNDRFSKLVSDTYKKQWPTKKNK